MMDRLNDITTLHKSEEADMRFQIAQLSIIYADATKSATERRDA
jgi:hypothetical protein